MKLYRPGNLIISEYHSYGYTNLHVLSSHRTTLNPDETLVYTCFNNFLINPSYMEVLRYVFERITKK